MASYKAYPTEKTTPKRRTRKGERSSTFLFNKNITKKARKEARRARNAE